MSYKSSAGDFNTTRGNIKISGAGFASIDRRANDIKELLDDVDLDGVLKKLDSIRAFVVDFKDKRLSAENTKVNEATVVVEKELPSNEHTLKVDERNNFFTEKAENGRSQDTGNARTR